MESKNGRQSRGALTLMRSIGVVQNAVFDRQFSPQPSPSYKTRQTPDKFGLKTRQISAIRPQVLGPALAV